MGKDNNIKVMGFGTFDAFHPGHLFYLKELKKMGDELIVVIARDQNVKRIKGSEPHFDENTRRRAVIETGVADKVVLGHEEDFYEVIRSHQPHVLGFGYDQRVNVEKLMDSFPAIEIRRTPPHFPEKYKSSIIKKNLIRK
jgi:FAD synthetase